MTQTSRLSRRMFVSAVALTGAALCSACAHAGAYDDFFTSICLLYTSPSPRD